MSDNGQVKHEHMTLPRQRLHDISAGPGTLPSKPPTTSMSLPRPAIKDTARPPTLMRQHVSTIPHSQSTSSVPISQMSIKLKLTVSPPTSLPRRPLVSAGADKSMYIETSNVHTLPRNGIASSAFHGAISGRQSSAYRLNDVSPSLTAAVSVNNNAAGTATTNMPISDQKTTTSTIQYGNAILQPSDRHYPVFVRDASQNTRPLAVTGALLKNKSNPWPEVLGAQDTSSDPFPRLFAEKTSAAVRFEALRAQRSSSSEQQSARGGIINEVVDAAIIASSTIDHEDFLGKRSRGDNVPVGNAVNPVLIMPGGIRSGDQDTLRRDLSSIQPVGAPVDVVVSNFYQPPTSLLAVSAKSSSKPLLSAKEMNILLLHVCRIGDSNSLRSLIRSPKLDINKPDDEGRTALMFAAIGGHIEIIQLLLESGSLVHHSDFCGRTGLHWAARFGIAAAVILLLKAGADITNQDFQGKTALHCVAMSDNTEALAHILQHAMHFGISSSTFAKYAPHQLLRKTQSDVFPLAITETKKFDIDCRDDDQMTPLMWSAYCGHTRQCAALIAAGSKLDLQDTEGKTCLHWAMSNKHSEIVTVLVEAHPEWIQCRDKYGRTPLHLACADGNIGVVYYLLGVWSAAMNNTDEAGRTPVHWSSICGNGSVVKLLCDFGAKLNKRDKSGATALHYAAQQNYRDCVHILLRKGASVLCCDDSGRPPLMWACIQGHVEVAKMLVQAKSDVNAREERGFTALHFAANAGHTACVLFMLQSKADFDAVDFKGHTPLFRAAALGHADTVLALLTENASIDIQDLTGQTALHVSSGAGHIDVVNLLIGHGADLSIKDNRGAVPIHEAAFHGTSDTLMLLLSHTDDVSLRDSGGVTPLHWAAVNGHISCCRTLIQHGARVNAMRDTPLDYAYLNNNFECAQLLVETGALMAEEILFKSAVIIQRAWKTNLMKLRTRRRIYDWKFVISLQRAVRKYLVRKRSRDKIEPPDKDRFIAKQAREKQKFTTMPMQISRTSTTSNQFNSLDRYASRSTKKTIEEKLAAIGHRALPNMTNVSIQTLMKLKAISKKQSAGALDSEADLATIYQTSSDCLPDDFSIMKRQI